MLGSKLPNEGSELRYSLRSLRNMPHGKVWLYTPRLPEWVDPDTVGHIPWEQRDGKYEDLSAKWLELATLDYLPNKITYMDDDMYIIKPVDGPVAAHNATMQNMLIITERIQQRTIGRYDVHETYLNTYRLMLEHGVEKPLCPIQHIPWPVTRSHIPVHWEDGNGPYEYKTLTYNYRQSQGRRLSTEVKAATREDLRNVLARGGAWLSSDDHFKFYESGVASYLSATFPERSAYERR